MAQWVARPTRNVEVVGSMTRNVGVVGLMTRNVGVVGSSPIKVPPPPNVSLINKLYPYCLVLVGSRNGFECAFTLELK